MLKLVNIVSIGKAPPETIKFMINNYTKRFERDINIKFFEYKKLKSAVAMLDRCKNVFLLDAEGKEFNSNDFAKEINSYTDITFLIGSSDGFESNFKKKYNMISFSKMTFPHQITKLLLVEQIYRSYEIKKGTKYHK